MNKLKITNSLDDNRISSVILNGEEISNKITGVTLKMNGGKYPRAVIEVPLSEVEVEGDFDVLKKIPSEKHGTDIVINGVKVAECSNPKEIARAIADDINSTFKPKNSILTDSNYDLCKNKETGKIYAFKFEQNKEIFKLISLDNVFETQYVTLEFFRENYKTINYDTTRIHY